MNVENAVLYVFSGLPGTGKTALAQRLALARHAPTRVNTATASNHVMPLFRASVCPIGLRFSIGNITPGRETECSLIRLEEQWRNQSANCYPRSRSATLFPGGAGQADH